MTVGERIERATRSIRRSARDFFHWLEDCVKSEAELVKPFIVTEIDACVACTNLTRKDVLQVLRPCSFIAFA